MKRPARETRGGKIPLSTDPFSSNVSSGKRISERASSREIREEDEMGRVFKGNATCNKYFASSNGEQAWRKIVKRTYVGRRGVPLPVYVVL